MGKWLKVSDYAKHKDITVNTVNKKVRQGKLKSKLENGLRMVYADDLPEDTISETEKADAAYSLAMQRKTSLDNELKQEKLNNLRQDTLLKKQKNTLTKQLYRQEYAEGVLQCFSSAFANVKNLLIDLKLTAEQNQNFQTAFRKALKRFEENLTNYLAQKDKDEEKALADENTKEN